MSLDIDELLELEEAVSDYLKNNLEKLLISLNRTGKLQEFLSLIDLDDFLIPEDPAYNENAGKILVIGQSQVSENEFYML